jgi:hypothetical protein
MTTRKKANPPECNPAVDGFLDWMDSPDGELSIEVMDTVFALLDNVDVDAKARKLIWPDGQRLSLDQRSLSLSPPNLKSVRELGTLEP